MSSIEQLASTTAVQVDQANSAQDSATLVEDFDLFLQLLTTQLQNQDPLDPMDTDEMTDQITQFSQVEQQIQTNAHLETVIESTEAQAVNAVMNYLGTDVTVEGVTNTLTDGSATWTLNANGPAEESQVSIMDANGREVYSETRSLSAGETSFEWDGSTNSGQQAEDGVYQIRVEGKNAAGDAVSVSTSVKGTVTGIDLTGTEPILQVGAMEVRQSAILAVEAPAS